jgi:hypothetical protein
MLSHKPCLLGESLEAAGRDVFAGRGHQGNPDLSIRLQQSKSATYSIQKDVAGISLVKQKLKHLTLTH